MSFGRRFLFRIGWLLPLLPAGIMLWLEIAIVHSPAGKSFVVLGGMVVVMVGCWLVDVLEEQCRHYRREALARQRLQQFRTL